MKSYTENFDSKLIKILVLALFELNREAKELPSIWVPHLLHMALALVQQFHRVQYCIRTQTVDLN